MNIYRPDVFVSMSDEIGVNLTAARCRTSATRSLKWLDEVLELKLSSTTTYSPLIFASVEGGGDMESRSICATQMAQRDVDGFAIGGVGLDESRETRQRILSEVCSKLPDAKPRLLCGSFGPQQVLDAVEEGMDLFDASYPISLSKLGYAATFSITDNNGPQASKLNLRDRSYARDASPILEGCECHACRFHTRSYIHHLLNTRELLADVLLQVYVEAQVFSKHCFPFCVNDFLFSV